MTNLSKMPYLVAVILLLGTAPVTFGQVGIVREGSEQILKWIAKSGTKESAEELSKLGGERALRRALEKVYEEGGETLVNRMVKFTQAHGLGALKSIEATPKLFLNSLEEIPPDLVLKAVQAIKRDPELLSKLTTDFGSSALEVAARHPGVGPVIARKFGNEGIEFAARVDTPTLIRLGRISSPISKLPPHDRKQLLKVLSESPGKLISFLENHPKVLFTSAGVASFISAKDQILGSHEIVVGKDGTLEVLTKPGFMATMTSGAMQTFKGPIAVLFGCMALLIIGWGGTKIWGTARRERVKVEIAERKLQMKPRKQEGKS